MDAERKKRNFLPHIQRRLHGRTFQKNGSHNDKIYYRCATLNCHATAFSKSDNVLHMGKNAHAPHCEDDGKDEVVAMKHWMKTELQEKWWKFLELYEEACKRFDDAAGKVSLDRIRSTLKVWRLKVFPPTPVTMTQFAEQLNEGQYDCILKYKTHKLEFSVVQDEDNCVHILFYDREFINTNLRRIMQLFVDATFDTRPKLNDCMQLLTILGIYVGRAVPMFHVAMSRRTRNAYLAVFKKVVEVNAFQTVLMILSDFENPLRETLAEIFPLAKVVGCNFHFDKAIYGKLKTLKLIDEIKSRPSLENAIKKILALAFLPKHMIVLEYFRQKESMEAEIRLLLSAFLAYFERYWLKIVTPAGFSVFGLTNRSNNISESWNSELFHILGPRPVAAHMTQKLMILTVKVRSQVEQRKNFQYGSTLPRYQTQYKDAELKKGWIKLLDPDANFPAEEFIECAARLKGNLNEKLKNFRNGLITLQTEMSTRPTIVPMSKDLEFDLSLVMDSASRRVYEKLKRQPVQNQDVPHVYQQIGGQVALQILEDQARAILITKMGDDVDEVQQPNLSNENNVHDREQDTSQRQDSQNNDDDVQPSNDDDDDEVIPPKRQRRGLFESQAMSEDGNVVTSENNKKRQSSSQISSQSDPISAAPNAHIQNDVSPSDRGSMDLFADPSPKGSKDSFISPTPKSVTKNADIPDWLANNVQISDKGFQSMIEEIEASDKILPLRPMPLDQVHSASVVQTEDESSIIPETQDDQETHDNACASAKIIEDSDIDMFASDDEDSVPPSPNAVLPAKGILIITDSVTSKIQTVTATSEKRSVTATSEKQTVTETSEKQTVTATSKKQTATAISQKQTVTASNKKSKKKNRPGFNDRRRLLEKSIGAPKTPENQKPKKKRKRYKKKKQN